jgi:hypothetical protein
MSLNFEISEDTGRAEYDAGDLTTARETYEQHLSAGILFPEEIRNAERVLRYLNKFSESPISPMPASEKIPA